MGKYLELFWNRIAKAVEPYGAGSAFCRKAGVSRQALESWLERRSGPTLETLERVAEALEIEPWRLIMPQGEDVVAKSKYVEDLRSYAEQDSDMQALERRLAKATARIEELEAQVEQSAFVPPDILGDMRTMFKDVDWEDIRRFIRDKRDARLRAASQIKKKTRGHGA